MHISSQNVLKNLIWKFAERCGAQGISLFVSILLARLLTPQDYGTAVLVMAFLTVLQVFVTSGLGTALFQRKGTDALDFSSVFFANIVLTLALYGVICLTAPLVASFYQAPELTSLLRASGLMLPLAALRNVQQAFVLKYMMFRKFFFATLIASLCSAIIGVCMAYEGFGSWALVGQQLTSIAVGVMTMWLTVPWRPTFVFSFERLRTLWSFGWKLLVATLLESGVGQLGNFIIGKVFSPTDLAFYRQGEKFPYAIVGNVSASIDAVLLPAMSHEQDNRIRVRDLTRRTIKTSIFIMAPLMIGMAFASEILVRVVWTEKWLPCVPFLCIACLNYLFLPIHTANLNATVALGRSDLYLKMKLLTNVVLVLCLLFSLRYGVLAIAYGTVIGGMVNQVINAWPNRNLLDYGYLSQLRDFAPSVILAIGAGCSIYPLKFLDLPIWGILILQIMGVVVLYIASAWVFKVDSLLYILGLVKKTFCYKSASNG